MSIKNQDWYADHYCELEEEITELKDQKAELEEEITELKDRNAELQEEMVKLIMQLLSLQLENNQLKHLLYDSDGGIVWTC